MTRSRKGVLAPLDHIFSKEVFGLLFFMMLKAALTSAFTLLPVFVM